MADRARVGFIGVGLMGHGVAKNILQNGEFPLMILGNRNRTPVDDLVTRGAREASSTLDLAASSDVVILCLPSSAEVETVVHGRDGLIGGLRRGAVLIDATTSDPSVTRRIGSELASLGVDMLDAALGRTPKEAEAGKLSTYVGGEAGVLDRVRPILRTYADTVDRGPLGAGTTCKLVNNSITIGMAALFAEGFVTAARIGANLDALADVLSAGGADGRMWRMMEPWIRAGDDFHLRGPLRIAAKDIRAYVSLAESVAGSAIPILQAVDRTLRTALDQGNAEVFLPALPGVLAELQGVGLRAGSKE